MNECLDNGHRVKGLRIWWVSVSKGDWDIHCWLCCSPSPLNDFVLIPRKVEREEGTPGLSSPPSSPEFKEVVLLVKKICYPMYLFDPLNCPRKELSEL